MTASGAGGAGAARGPGAAGGAGVAPSRLLVPALLVVALVVAAIGSLGAPLITSVATQLRVSLGSAQWTLTITLLAGAVTTPVLGRLGSGPARRATVITTLAVVLAGSVLTVLPLGFGWLLAGRAAQGSGLGLTALMMGAARDQLPRERAAATIALISVASTIGVGIGYPLAGLLAELGGLRAAYGLGAVVSVLALAVTVVAVPAARPSSPAASPASPASSAPAGRAGRVDVAGAVLLAAGLAALLIAASEPRLWHGPAIGAIGCLSGGTVLLITWVAVERRAAAPLVDVVLARHPAVLGANATMLAGGAGMYLLLTIVTRYVQTPRSAGYGFGASTFVAGLALVPFSALGFAGGRLGPWLRRRLSPDAVLAVSATVVLAACLVFALARTQFAEALTVMAILGCGVGSFSAAMPAVILAVTPAGETASAMGVNQVVRSVGFAVGSAVGGAILAAGTRPGHAFPASPGYTAAAGTAGVIMLVTAVLALGPGRRAASRRRAGRG